MKFSADNKGIWCELSGPEAPVSNQYVDFNGKILLDIPYVGYEFYQYLFNDDTTQYLVWYHGDDLENRSVGIMSYTPGDKALKLKGKIEETLTFPDHCYNKKTKAFYSHNGDDVVLKTDMSTMKTKAVLTTKPGDEIKNLAVFDDFLCVILFNPNTEKTILQFIPI